MNALRYSEDKGLRVERVPIPTPAAHEATIKISRCGICSTDLEIIRGYVPGFNHTLGHEFVGTVVQAESAPALVGRRVVGEINCRSPDHPCTHPDPIFVRNHAPFRTVLGIIGRDGSAAEYACVDVDNLHVVPDDVDDVEAAFAEPLAAACRIVEQGVVGAGDAVAVIGDGKLGLLVAHVLARHLESCGRADGTSPKNPKNTITFFGRHEEKMALVVGVERVVVPDDARQLQERYAAKFDVVVEATGSTHGIKLAVALTRPLGTIVQKSTCSSVVKVDADASSSSSRSPKPPLASEIVNDIVVQEIRMVGSRCGPFPPALELLRRSDTKALVGAMVSHEMALEDGVAAIEAAQRKGTLKVQLMC